LAACSKSEPPAAVAAAPVKDAGGSLPPDKAQPSGQIPSAPAPLPAPDGEAIFKQTCATCHMADGSGVPFLQPPIKGSAWISAPDPQSLLSLILRGSPVMGEAAKAFDNDMPPLDRFSDAEIAAVATYVRQRFAAAPIAEPVTPAQVAIARARPGLPE